jgi:hypothetical protein
MPPEGLSTAPVRDAPREPVSELWHACAGLAGGSRSRFGWRPGRLRVLVPARGPQEPIHCTPRGSRSRYLHKRLIFKRSLASPQCTTPIYKDLRRALGNQSEDRIPTFTYPADLVPEGRWLGFRGPFPWFLRAADLVFEGPFHGS